MTDSENCRYRLTISQSSANVGWLRPASQDEPAEPGWVLFSVFDRERAGEGDGNVALIEASAESVGVPRDFAAALGAMASEPYKLPPHVVAALRSVIVFEPGEKDVVWLEFGQPVGYLPVVPWERLLLESCGFASIRMGSGGTASIEPRNAIDAVLCFSCPASSGSDWSAEKVVELYLSMIPNVTKKMRLHVFADKESRPILYRNRARFGSSWEVIVYTPRADAAYLDASKNQTPASRRAPQDGFGQALMQLTHTANRAARAISRTPAPATPLENPWLVWMRDELEHVSIEYAHFVCHGYLGSESGGLLFANPFLTDDPRWARYVSARELNDFLAWIGAWSAGVTSPPTDHAAGGIRYLFHELSSLRAGPLLVHEMRSDRERDGLSKGYQLFADPPAYKGSSAITAWWHPDRLSQDEMLRDKSTTLAPYLDAARDEEGELPHWIVKAQRALEVTSAQLNRMPESENDAALLSGVKSALAVTAKLLAETIEQSREKGTR